MSIGNVAASPGGAIYSSGDVRPLGAGVDMGAFEGAAYPPPPLGTALIFK